MLNSHCALLSFWIQSSAQKCHQISSQIHRFDPTFSPSNLSNLTLGHNFLKFKFQNWFQTQKHWRARVKISPKFRLTFLEFSVTDFTKFSSQTRNQAVLRSIFFKKQLFFTFFETRFYVKSIFDNFRDSKTADLQVLRALNFDFW